MDVSNHLSVIDEKRYTWLRQETDKYSKTVNSYYLSAMNSNNKMDYMLMPIAIDMGAEVKGYYKDYFFLLKENNLLEEYSNENKEGDLRLSSVDLFMNSYHV